MRYTLDQIIKNIPKQDKKNPTIIFLLEQFEKQFESILTLKEQNQLLKDEIARLKNQNPKPKIKPSKLPKDPKPKPSLKGTNQKKKKKTATLKIDKVERISPEHIPNGSIFKGLNSYTVRGLQIVSFNTRYLLEQWQTPEEKLLPENYPLM